MPFRLGRKHASHTYPESRGVGSPPYARNSASGPAALYTVTATPTRIPWGTLEVGAPGQEVTVTPKVTGLIHLIGVVESGANTENTGGLIVQIGIDGVLQDTPLEANPTGVLVGTSKTTVPIQAILGLFTLGIPVTFSLFVSVDSNLNPVNLGIDNSWLTLQEVSLPTG
jgi:hypothetical protein